MEAELLEHHYILDQYMSEYMSECDSDKGDINMEDFIVWIAEDKEDEKLNKFKAIVYLNSRTSLESLCIHKDIREVLYDGMRKKLPLYLDEKKISRETYEHYDKTIPAVGK